MIIFLHNSKCSKSREALKVMSNAWKSFTLREYLKWPLDLDELEELHEKLWWKVIDFTRIDEPEFKSCNLNKNSTDKELLKAMSRFPKLMQRPIVFNEKKAFIWRPAEEVLKIFRK